ncbi:MAG: MFS transporter [Bdellovibrionota bacterium]|nr:MFS transporter [Bdellovibrionota bacterium]
MNLVKAVGIQEEREIHYILILALIQFAHMVDFVVLMPLGPTLMESLQISPVQFGSLVSSYNFTAAFFGLCFGAFADGFDRKVLMLFALSGFIVGTFCCALAPNFELLLASRMFTGAFGGMMNGLIFAVISDLIPFERRGKAMGIVMSSFSVASVIGVPIGLAISDASNWHFTFVFIGVFSLLIFAAAQLVFPNITDHMDRPKVAFFKRVKGLFKNKLYLISFGFIFMVSGSMFLLIPFLSPFAVKNMGMGPDKLKYMYLVGGLFTVVTARIVGVSTDRVGALRLFSLIVFVSFIPVILYTHSGETTFLIYLIYGTFFMTMVSGRMIPCMTLISEVPSSEDRGFFMSVLHSIRACGSATMTFLAGFIIHEGTQGELMGFDRAGYLSIVMGLATVVMATIIAYKLKKSKAVVF